MESKALLQHWAEAKGIFKERRKQGKPEFPTGLRFLDDVTDGMKRGEVWIIAGHTGGGKTSLALQIAQSFADNPEHHILFCSLEMKGWELTTRLFCEMNEINYSQLKKGDFPDNFEELNNKFEDYLTTIDFEIYEYGYNFNQITEILKNGYKNRKPDIIFIDFIQQIEWMSYKEERIALTEYIRKLAELAKTQNIGIVVVSQLRRLPSGAKYDREPDLIDLKGSGALEQMASKVIFTYGIEESGEKRYYIDIAKNRQGETIKKEVLFQGWIYKFKEITLTKEQEALKNEVQKTFQ